MLEQRRTSPVPNPMGARHYLRCLGTVALLTPAGEPSRFRVRKHLALLVYLAVEPRVPHRRDRLADLLWPRVPLSEGRHSLATAVSVLRGKLGSDAFEADRDRIRFTCTHLDLDLDRLTSGQVLGDEFTPPLEVGGFLAEFEVPDAGEFMHWRERQSARLLPAIRDGLIRLMDRCRRTGDFRRIEGFAERMLAIDELSEEAIRAKMEARAFDGDRLTALKIFEAWKVSLQAELGATPSPLVEGIALRLRRRGWERTTTNNIPTVPTDQWKGRLFVGRTGEYRALYEAWEQTGQRSARHALVLGDSGIGKSTLVERLTTAAGLEGAATARVQCYEVEREIPYAAVSGLVRGLLDRPGVSGTPPDSLAELARTVSDVRQRFPAIPIAPESQGESARVQLAEALHQLVAAVAEESPVILVIDDVHLADDASVAVMHLLLRRVESQRIMVVLTARPGELARAPNAARLRENHQRLGIALVELPPMSDDEGNQLLDSLLIADQPRPGATERRAILRAAAGFPMVLELLLQDWQSNGERSIALAMGAMTTDPGGASTPENAYRQLLERIFQDLEPPTRNVLNLAAILGGRLNELDMYTLVDLSLAQTMNGMSRLTELRLLRDGGQELEFRNELIRAQAYLGVPSPLRRALHGQIADRLLEAEGQGRSVPGLEIAWHCIRAGRMAEGTPYLIQGAREALEQGAAYEVELALTSALDHLCGALRTQAVLLLAEALQEQSRWNDSRVVLTREGMIPPPGEPTFARLLFLTASRRELEINADSESLYLAELLRLAEGNYEPKIRIGAASLAARNRREAENWDCASSFLRALDTIPSTMTLNEQERFALVKAKLLFRTHARGECRTWLETGLRYIKERRRVNAFAVDVYLGLGVCSTLDGDYDRSVDFLRMAYETATRLGDDASSAAAASNLALSYCRLGQYDKQILWSERAISQSGDYEDYTKLQATALAALAYAITGDSSRALDYTRRGNSLVNPYLRPWQIQAWYLQGADVLQVLGRSSDAEHTARVAVGRDDLLSRSFGGPFARWIARLGFKDRAIQTTHERLQRLVESLDDYDKKDQVEILHALVWLEAQTGTTRMEKLTLLQEKLGALPRGISDQLNRMGMNCGLERALGLPNPAVSPAGYAL